MSEGMRTVVLALTLGIGWGLGNVAWADPIRPGFDLYATTSASIDFSFICGNCELISLQGNPIGPGNTDTIVQRLVGIDPFPAFEPPPIGCIFCPGPPAIPLIDIELVSLSLRSVEPINVEGSSFVEDGAYDVFVRGQTLGSSVGSMDISHDDANGGSFFSIINALQPGDLDITFVEVGNPLNEISLQIFFALQGNGQWSHTAPLLYPNDPVNFPGGGFFPGPLVLAGGIPIITPVEGPCDSIFGFCFTFDIAGLETHLVPAEITGLPDPIPEPTTLLLLGSGLAGLAGLGRKKLSRKA